jgi:hypothetical protein
MCAHKIKYNVAAIFLSIGNSMETGRGRLLRNASMAGKRGFLAQKSGKRLMQFA